ncbi:hypothetical protein G7085_19070 [Tessaracoccus sp. HDW20]|uniref:hypothetical protein n=1 Tax=Tessaracoccus coleopterorum TaxID=2714950 RepID=UPI0018D4CCD1|nr:hypothetical protein [Tessaracoccus coleopterorum]NHB85934.1 hypothetical protein [Tessaracoccus coleopterorum]
MRFRRGEVVGAGGSSRPIVGSASRSSTSQAGPPGSSGGAVTMDSSSSTSSSDRAHPGATAVTRAGMTSSTVISVVRSSAGLLVTSARVTRTTTAGEAVLG